MNISKFLFTVIFLFSIGTGLYGQETTGLNIGDKAPNIIDKGIYGDTIELESLRGKIVLIDFWASYCGICRSKHRELVPLYEKYKDAYFENGDGFTVFSVSLDRNRDRWVNAVERDSLKWPYQVSDLEGLFSSKYSKTYKASIIPENYLIDGDGIIIGKNLFGAKLEEALKQIAR